MLLTVDEFEVVFAGASVANNENVPLPFLAMVLPYFVGYGWGMFKKQTRPLGKTEASEPIFVEGGILKLAVFAASVFVFYHFARLVWGVVF